MIELVVEKGIYRVEHYRNRSTTTSIEEEEQYLEDRTRDICSTKYPYTRCTCRLYTIKWKERNND